MRESTALGAATAAGVHLDIGIWKGGFKAFAERARESKEVLQIFTPKINDEEREKEYALWQKAIDTTIGVKSKTTGKREP
ncbi:hypothetical protein BGZ89_006529 [Linnemannia elongata]|nr:hypothetical protein BGZ89_006529 [Linnemannia elongata]